MKTRLALKRTEEERRGEERRGGERKEIPKLRSGGLFLNLHEVLSGKIILCVVYISVLE